MYICVPFVSIKKFLSTKCSFLVMPCPESRPCSLDDYHVNTMSTLLKGQARNGYKIFINLFIFAEQTLQHCLDYHIFKRTKGNPSTNRNCCDLYQKLTIQLKQNNNRAQQSDHVWIVFSSDHPVAPVK